MPDKSDPPASNLAATPETFRYLHRVTYSDCTVGNHIYYARYLDLLEAARGELIRHSGLSLQDWQDKGFIFPVMECRLRYKHPARYDDLLAIEVWLTEAGRLRFNFGYRIVNQSGQLILEAETFHVCTGVDEKPRRGPEELCRNLSRYITVGGNSASVPHPV